MKFMSEQAEVLLANSGASRRIQKELRLVLQNVEIESVHELYALHGKSEASGILIVKISGNFYARPYELKKRIVDNATGRSRAITCDFCYTWQKGEFAANIIFALDKTRKVSYLVCSDLQCSLHVRGLTRAALLSRSQLREDMEVEDRINRLEAQIQKLVVELE